MSRGDTEIGTLTVSGNGNRGDYDNDAGKNPAGRDHVLLYDAENERYSIVLLPDESVTFTPTGPGRDGKYNWERKDKAGTVIDSGTMVKS